jgi:predicted O-methyltransferase YrrM
MLNRGKFKSQVLRSLGIERNHYLKYAIVELNTASELCKVFGWTQEPILDDKTIYDYAAIEDANGRRVRDAETLGSVVRNVIPKVCVDIGTASGHSAALMAVNAPQAQIYTINIPLEEIIAGEGGLLTTIALSREEIGAYYRQRAINNITQILANTARWMPDMETIDVAFIDGSHDTEFVYNDTRKVLKCMVPGSFIVWHDFNPALQDTYHWIADVCLGIEKLLEDGYLNGRIFHVRDSWMGVYQVN